MKKRHPKDKRERMLLDAARKSKLEKKESAYIRRRTADLKEKEAEDDIREEVR